MGVHGLPSLVPISLARPGDPADVQSGDWTVDGGPGNHAICHKKRDCKQSPENPDQHGRCLILRAILPGPDGVPCLVSGESQPMPNRLPTKSPLP